MQTPTQKRKWLTGLILSLILALAVGFTGCSGSDGAPGLQGAKGDPGDSGDSGDPGADGKDGLDAPGANPWPSPTYAGEQACKLCHADVHEQWKTSWHTRKTTWGPASANTTVAVGRAKFLPGVISMWEKGDIKSHMVLDNGTGDHALTQAEKDLGYNSKIVVTKKKYAWDEVEVIIGETRKQRYAVYYDGGPVAEAYYGYSSDRGINWSVDTAMEPVAYAGNRERAGYKFLTIEMNALKNPVEQKGSMYGTWRSWQEQCIGCHTTGFDPDAWNKAKAAYVATGEGDLRDIYVADIRIACEACHGPGQQHISYQFWGEGQETIINPAKLSYSDPTRKMVCEQCHTRAQTNIMYGGGANDNRGFVLGEHDFMDVMEYTRPAWGEGNRQVSNDGKGRRDHQQDMDMRLTAYTKPVSYHTGQACFDCHDSHNVGNYSGTTKYATSLADKSVFTTKKDPDGLVRLKKTRTANCGLCHADQAALYLTALDGRKGWEGEDDYPYGYGAWENKVGRADRKQHIFNFEDVTTTSLQRSLGLTSDKYTWVLKVGGDSTASGDWLAMWPWEEDYFRGKGHTTFFKGAVPTTYNTP